ncbi:peptidoglycan endopeptidase LytE [Jeotgalicoccus aerolatus]|uniref:Peptidoglycan endopeptidase LytE n=1 Tax=Jeotgalicoccus aerolatus TaxID=709510 RepID=A0A1G9C731_9STAP|nr:LysM peptidoglycan-binding domain-containing protein [Jeotgalicoccus aerolatus]SDK47478.1 peptidoglycan endopeptidase LytE [Jeotgalicoccus aerolatus]
MKKTIISAASLTALSAVAAANISASEVTVESGDTLWSISAGASQSIEEIKSLNNLSSDLIFPGDVLKVDAEAPSAAPAEETEADNDATTYTIEAGDTLFAIASQFDISIDEIKAWNNLSSDLIIAGKTIVVAEEAAPEAASVQEAPEAEEAAAPAVEEVEAAEVEEVEVEETAAPAVEEVEEVQETPEVEETEEVEQPQAAPAAEPAVTGGNAAAVANSLAAGKSYVYGGNSASAVDCSAFTQQFMAAFNGKSIPRTTYGQQAAGTQVSNPQPGDLVFFNNFSHVGVYIGNGQMVDALNPSEGVGQRAVSYVHGHVDGYYRF